MKGYERQREERRRFEEAYPHLVAQSEPVRDRPLTPAEAAERSKLRHEAAQRRSHTGRTPKAGPYSDPERWGL